MISWQTKYDRITITMTSVLDLFFVVYLNMLPIITLGYCVLNWATFWIRKDVKQEIEEK